MRSKSSSRSALSTTALRTHVSLCGHPVPEQLTSTNSNSCSFSPTRQLRPRLVRQVRHTRDKVRFPTRTKAREKEHPARAPQLQFKISTASPRADVLPLRS